MSAPLVVVAIVVLVALSVVVLYNGLIRRRNRIDSAWAQIDVQLQRRYDLIPNLVESVKGYASHERELFERVAQARTQAMAAPATPAARSQAEQQVTGALRGLLAVAESNPDLKANQNFLALQEELVGTEGRIAYARQFYNDTVQDWNTRIQAFPGRLVAASFKFTPREYFEADDTSRGPVGVQF
ncbi:MAG TPA: LemA family protein [Acidimicrobiales bacterium]|jgi:LemA protein|nr:LemA family protein [Acidimicrobiales bacterium]